MDVTYTDNGTAEHITYTFVNTFAGFVISTFKANSRLFCVFYHRTLLLHPHPQIKISIIKPYRKLSTHSHQNALNQCQPPPDHLHPTTPPKQRHRNKNNNKTLPPIPPPPPKKKKKKKTTKYNHPPPPPPPKKKKKKRRRNKPTPKTPTHANGKPRPVTHLFAWTPSSCLPSSRCRCPRGRRRRRSPRSPSACSRSRCWCRRAPCPPGCWAASAPPC